MEVSEVNLKQGLADDRQIPCTNRRKHYQKLLQDHVAKLSAMQQLHYASDRYAVL